MKFTKIIAFILILTCFIHSNLIAQEKKSLKAGEIEAFKGLKKAGSNDIDSKMQINLDGESIPVYNEEGKRIKGMEIMKILMSGDFKPDIYINETKEIKAVLMRKANENEKKQMQYMTTQSNTKENTHNKDAIPFEATDLHGKKYTLNELKGKIIVMNFWFTSCKPCVLEMPELNKLVKKHQDKDVLFLGFALNNQSELKAFLKKHSFAYKVIPNSGKIAKDYGLNSYPTHIIIDRNLKIVYSTTGFGPNTIKDIDLKISTQLKE